MKMDLRNKFCFTAVALILTFASVGAVASCTPTTTMWEDHFCGCSYYNLAYCQGVSGGTGCDPLGGSLIYCNCGGNLQPAKQCTYHATRWPIDPDLQFMAKSRPVQI